MKARFAFFFAVAAVAVLAACGGGGGGGYTPPPATPTPVGTATPPAQVTTNVTFGTATASPLPTTASGATGTISLPAGTGSATLTYSAVAPSPGPAGIQARKRGATSTVQSNTGLVYLTLTATSSVTLNGVPGVAVTLPTGAAPAGSQFFVGYYGATTGQTPAAQQAAWVSSSSTAATASGGVVTIPATSTPTFTLTQGQSVYFVLYYGYYIPPINILGCDGVQPAAVHRQLVGVTPVTPGSAWNYTGTLTQTIVRSSPCPIPTPAAPTTATVTVAVTIAPAPPGAPVGTVDEHSVESDAFATNTTVLTTDAIVTGSVESSETSTDSTGNSVATTYGSGGLTYDAAGTNNPPATVNTTFEDGTTYARTYSGTTGAYTETDVPAGIPSPHTTITVNADGSAAYTFTTINPNSGVLGTQAVTMGAPSGGAISLVFGTGSAPVSVPAWFTAGSALYSDVTVSSAFTALPSSCSSAALGGGGTTGNEFARTISVIDPALGYTDTRTIDGYVVTNYANSGRTVGPVCVVISDTQNLYYDFLLDSPFGLFYTSDGKPLQVSTLSESYYFFSAPTGYARVRNDAQTAATAMTLALRASAIPFERTVEHAQRLEQFEKIATQQHLGGVR